MSGIVLLDFQQTAVNKLVGGAVDYFHNGQDRLGGRPIPYVGQLKAVTGAGKTPILAAAVSKFSPAIILWTTKFGSVVDQTAVNLGPGGKYHHLLAPGVEIIRFSEIRSSAEWQRILEREDRLTILISTVAAWNSSEKDDRLNVHRISKDWGGDKSRWDQLRQDRKRPLWVVYDEAHNTTSEQVELLDELEPAGFLVASASPVGGKLQYYLTNLSEEQRKQRIVPVSTRAVVDKQLLKSTISLADYHSSAEEMIADVVQKRTSLEQQLAIHGSRVKPRAIYVVEASNTSSANTEARPVVIWKTLVNKCGVDPQAIAVCTNTKDLPKDAVRVARIDQLSDAFSHIIFNKKLQEGWDDPTVYVCYFDGKTESANRIQQVLGRALRQPEVVHFPDEDLNTAYFYINCRSEKLDRITDELKEELRIYKSEDDPEGFEPFKIKEERRSPPKIPLKQKWQGELKVPYLQPELPPGDPLGSIVGKNTVGFEDDDRSAPGKALVNIVSVRTGDVEQNTRNLFEDMRVRCGSYLQEQIRSFSRDCANSMHPNTFSNRKLDKTACFKSKALDYYHGVALEVVQEYENRVRLELSADPIDGFYTVGPYQPTGDVPRAFKNAAHPNYDTKSFNDPEREVARALDKFSEFVWVRNRDRVGYGIPLPVKSGTSSTFYPDFLWWVNGTIWAIDPTGRFILNDKLRTKLLNVPSPLRIALIVPEKLDQNYQKVDDSGWTLVRFRSGNNRPEPHDGIDELLAQLITESAPAVKPKKAHPQPAKKAAQATKAAKATKKKSSRIG